VGRRGHSNTVGASSFTCTEGVNAKARGLMRPVLGAARTEEVLQRVNALEELDDVRALRPFLTLP